MSTGTHPDCPHSERVAELFGHSYFVKCATCNDTLITIPWYSAETLLTGTLTVNRTESPGREKVAEGPAEHLVPHIGPLVVSERLALTGQNAVINETQLGEIQNNSLTLQRDFFFRVVAENPRDETLPFALAQVLWEMGDKAAAKACYDAATATANARWFRRLPFFLLPTIIIAPVMWQLSIALWPAAFVGFAGIAFWLHIRRNRQRSLPEIGYWQRAEITANVDIAAELSRGVPTI
jgi:hypothetical protein